MLTKLEVDGFKTFEDLHVEFMPFTAILGNNAAGKSNLFDVIQLLSQLATRDVAEAVKPMRGEPLELFRQTPSGRAHQIRLAAEVLVDPVVRDPWGSEVTLTHTRLRYEVTLERREIRPGVERIQIAHEAVHPIMRKDDDWARVQRPSRDFRETYLKYARQKPWLTTDPSSSGPVFSIHQDGKAGRNRPASAAEATVLYSITNAEFPHLFALREEMRHWRLLQLDPALLHDPRHRGLVCFEEPENGIHPGRVRMLIQQLRNMVSNPADYKAAQPLQPLSQLFVNSHSPVVLSALLNRTESGTFHTIEGSVMFADSATVIDPERREKRRRTRLRLVDPSAQPTLPAIPGALVHPAEVQNILELARTTGEACNT